MREYNKRRLEAHRMPHVQNGSFTDSQGRVLVLQVATNFQRGTMHISPDAQKTREGLGVVMIG